MLWGAYLATGDEEPITRLLKLLPWSADTESIDKLTIGNMAKYTLADNASRSARLLGLSKTMSPRQRKEIATALSEVIRAADTVDTGYLRKNALATIDELKHKGPGSMRTMAWWGQMGAGAISIGCLGAAVPCVVGGAPIGRFADDRPAATMSV